ncbi:MAG: hypothetical protein H0T97_03180 [Actinobacteria bacterium]|nr:hypothetical protein [Actinomycetota bacterium]
MREVAVIDDLNGRESRLGQSRLDVGRDRSKPRREEYKHLLERERHPMMA